MANTQAPDPNLVLDPSKYLRPPVLDVPGGVALGIALINAASKRLPIAPKRALKVLRQQVLALQGDWAAQRKAELVVDEDRRPADQRLDRAWAAVAARLESLSVLPTSVPQSQQAALRFGRLFPTGLDFLKLPYEREWAESQQRLALVSEDDGTLGELVGEFLLDELRAAHADYGRVLGITSAKTPSALAPNLLEPLRAVQQSIVAYALQVVAAAHAEPDLLEIAAAALRPIDALREAQGRRNGTRGTTEPAPAPSPSVTPATPVPEMDDG